MEGSGTCNMWLHLACADASEPKRNIGTSLSTCECRCATSQRAAS